MDAWLRTASDETLEDLAEHIDDLVVDEDPQSAKPEVSMTVDN